MVWRDNPGAPFAFRAELIRLPQAGSSLNRPAEIAVEVALGAPFDMPIGLSVSGGSLSTAKTLVGAGRLRGDAIRVLSEGGPAIVRIDQMPAVQGCNESRYLPVCLAGIRAVAGAPLVLYGLPDQALAPGGSVRFDLPTAFPNFGAGTSYAVASSNPAAVEALIREGLLIVSADGGGETILTVTATGPDGRQETRRFAVKAKAPIRSRWGGWRSALLKPPPSENGDES